MHYIPFLALSVSVVVYGMRKLRPTSYSRCRDRINVGPFGSLDNGWGGGVAENVPNAPPPPLDGSSTCPGAVGCPALDFEQAG